MQEFLKSEHINPHSESEGTLIPWGLKHMFQTLWYNVFPLIKANLCFLLFSIPIITIPAAFYAMSKVCTEVVRENNVRIFDVFIFSVKKEFAVSFSLFFSVGIVLFLAVCGTLFYFQQGQEFRIFLILALITAVIGVLSFLMVPYCFTMAAITPLPIGKILKNAFLLSFLNLKYSILGSVLGIALITIQTLALVKLFPVALLIGIALVFYVETYCALYGIQRFVLNENL